MSLRIARPSRPGALAGALLLAVLTLPALSAGSAPQSDAPERPPSRIGDLEFFVGRWLAEIRTQQGHRYSNETIVDWSFDKRVVNVKGFVNVYGGRHQQLEAYLSWNPRTSDFAVWAVSGRGDLHRGRAVLKERTLVVEYEVQEPGKVTQLRDTIACASRDRCTWTVVAQVNGAWVERYRYDLVRQKA